MRSALVILGLLAVTVVGLVLGGRPTPDRAYELEQRLRCPVCKSVTVAESPSETAQTMRAAVRDQIAAGRSDQEVLDYFRARYGDWVLADPPFSGSTLLVWILPLVAVAVGAAVLMSRIGSPGSRSRSQVAVYVLAAAVAVVALVVVLPGNLAKRPTGGTVSGNEVMQGQRDLSTVTDEEMEKVIAANPGVAGMRLALARRYIGKAEYDKALGHLEQALPSAPEDTLTILNGLAARDDVPAAVKEKAVALSKAVR